MIKRQPIWALALPMLLIAQQGFSKSALEEVIVTASPHGKSAEEVAGSLNVLAGDSLQRQVAATLGDTLKNQIGINASSFGPGVGLPVIRGMSGKRVQVLQNSSPVSDASAASPDHAIANEPMLADRIEILRGPATLRFGPGAIGGVVNIIDNRIHTTAFSGIEGAIETRYDSNGDGTATVLRADGGNGAVSGHMSAVTRENDDLDIPGLAARTVDDPDETTHGFIANSDAKADAWNVGLAHVGEKLVLGFGVSRLDNNYGIPPGGHDHHGEVHGEEDHTDEDHTEEEPGHEEAPLFTRIDMNQTEYSGKILLPNLPGNLDKLDIDLSHTDYDHQEVEIEGASRAIGTRFETKADHVRAELSHGSASNWQGALGVQYGQTDFNAIGEEAFVPPSEVKTGGVFVTEETGLATGTLGLGLRFDRQTAQPDSGREQEHNLMNASVSYLYPVGDSQQISLIASHAERAPTAEELFSEGEHAATNSYQVGDAQLDREASNNLELTWSYTGTLSLNASLYYRDFSDFIFEAADGSRFSHDLESEGLAGGDACSGAIGDFEGNQEEFDAAPPCYFFHQQGAEFTGIEAEAVVPLAEFLSLRLWGDAVRAKLANSGDVPRIPPARLGVSVGFNRAGWYAGLDASHGFEQDNPGLNENSTEDYTRLDAHLSYSIEQWLLFLKGSNLSDEEIRNATSFLRDIAPEPGRAVVIGARYSF